MTYGTLNTITALDYNTFAQGGATVNHGVANINTLWGVGQGDKGYGQSSTLPAVASVTDTVTATQWATLLARLNSILAHQAGSGHGIAAPTTGSTVAYLAALSGAVTSAYTNRLTAATNAADVTGTAPAAASWNTATPTTLTITRTATWSSADQARYFFNAGGKLVLTFGAVNNISNAKGNDWVSLLNTKLGSMTVGAYSNSRGGTGGSVLAANTALGYWNAGTTDNSLLTLSSASGSFDYGSNSVAVAIKTNGVQGSNGDVGTVLTFTVTLTDVAADTFDDSVNLSITTNVTVRPPETTNLPTAIANPVIA
jgi:hypothetical protein